MTLPAINTQLAPPATLQETCERLIEARRDLAFLRQMAKIDGNSSAQTEIEALQKEFEKLQIEIGNSVKRKKHIRLPKIDPKPRSLPTEIRGVKVNEQALARINIKSRSRTPSE